MKIAILGYGKMGKAIETLALNKGYEVPLKIHRQNKEMLTIDRLQEVDVAIEFSRPELAVDHIRRCLEAGTPVVSGTTGWLDRFAEIEQWCAEKKGAFFYASNFSIGVNLFFALNKRLAEMMNDYPAYEVEMEEIHHTEKLDAPSGTAITLAQGILEKLERKKDWINEAADQKDTIAIHSKRIDKVPGTHSISYHSPVDSITIQHVAHSREGFARGRPAGGGMVDWEGRSIRDGRFFWLD